MNTQREALLRKAVECYRRAGSDNDACRCLEQLGDFRTAASLHEHAQRWLQAAHDFERAEQWPAAARCYRAAHQPLQAARCLVTADQPLEAGWLFAHEAHRIDRARAILARVTPDGQEEELALSLALARCASTRQRDDDGAIIRQVTSALPRLAVGPGRDRVVRWALTLADVWDRPDLTALIHAATVAASLPQAIAQWEQWAQQRLGSVAGIPVDAFETPSEEASK